MSYSIAQINTALANQAVKDCIAKKETKATEIASYQRRIDRIDADILKLDERKTEVSAKKVTAEAELASLEAQLQIDIANAL